MANEIVPDAREILDDTDLRRFSLLLEERIALKATIADAEAKLKELDPAITEMMTEAGAPRLQYGDSTVSLISSKRGNLSKTALVEAGVAASVIEKCTTYTSYSYLQVKDSQARA